MTWEDWPVETVTTSAVTNPAGVRQVAGSYVPDPDTASRVEAIAVRLQSVAAERKKLEEEEKFLRQRLTTLLPSGTTKAGDATVQIRPNRRFDAGLATEILTPLELEACSTTIISRALAQAKLSPERYAACQAEAGDPVVRVS